MHNAATGPLLSSGPRMSARVEGSLAGGEGQQNYFTGGPSPRRRAANLFLKL